MSVDRHNSHDAPPNTNPTSTAAKYGTSASTTVAAANPAAATVSNTFWPKRDRNRDSGSAPSTAPTPSAPSNRPYPDDDNPS